MSCTVCTGLTSCKPTYTSTINDKGTEIETCFIQVNYEHESTLQLHNSWNKAACHVFLPHLREFLTLMSSTDVSEPAVGSVISVVNNGQLPSSIKPTRFFLCAFRGHICTTAFRFSGSTLELCCSEPGEINMGHMCMKWKRT